MGVFNTSGRIPASATLAGVTGQKTSGDSYFNFNGGQGQLKKDATVTFRFEDRSSVSFKLKNCKPGGSTKIF